MRKLLQISLLVNFFIFFNAQNKSTLSINSKSLSILAAEYKEIYAAAKVIMTNLLAENKNTETNHVNFSSSDISSRNAADLTIDPKNKEFKSKPHLNWVSDMSYNFSPGFGDDDNIFYRARVSSGLDWLALGEGSLKSQKMQNALNEKMRNIDVLEKQKYKKEIIHRQNMSQVRAAFDARKIKLLSDYENLLKLQNEFTVKQNKNGLKNDAEAAQSKYRLDKISIERKSLESLIKNNDSQNFNNEIVNSEIPDLMAVENIDFSALVKDKETALKMEKELLDMKRKRDKQPDLRLKLRYNYYSALSRDRNFASVGATFNLPVTRSNNDLESEDEIRLKENSLQDMQLVYRDRLSTMYREYYLLKSEIEVLESEIKYLEAELKLNSTNEKSNTFSPAPYLATAEKLLNNQIQICDKKADLYEKYLEYKMLSGTDNSAEGLQKLANDDNVGKETYIWSSFFTNYSNAYIINLMNHWHINRVFLSVGKVTDLVKVADFMTLAAQNNIQVYRLIGENSYAATDNGFPDLQVALQDAKNMGFAAVHLDIEPHTFDDYKANVDLYAQRLINLFSNSKIWCTQNNMDLGVSVPMHLPAEVATVLHDNDIMTYIMAYDVLTLDKKLNKTLNIRNILSPNLYVWVFRINDFQAFGDLLDAEAYVQAAGVTKIGYYDLSQMNNFKP